MKNEGIVEWFAGKTVFITGGTGFMGKVLIEKLLRCCPDLKRIYILGRAKKGYSPNARLDEMGKLPLFQKLQKEQPSALKKVSVLEGDLLQRNLGLTEDQKRTVCEEVSIVINGAASLRLEAGLKQAVENNTIGTERVLKLAKDMKNLKAFIHLSTAFCHCEYELLEETVYPSPVDPHDIMRVVEWMDENTLNTITPRLLGPHPNCYTYSKRLAEALVNKYANELPIAIVRPSIVIPSLKDPIPGWVDSLNGPVGVVVAGGKGLIRSMLCAAEYAAEVIPVDIAINAIIIIAWKRANTSISETESLPVYNISNGDIVTMTWGEVLEKGKKITYEYPFEAGLWYPNGTIRMNPLTHSLIVFFLQTIPAYLLDGIFLLVGQKTFMVRVQNRISVGMKVLQYFTTRQWRFVNEKCLTLFDTLNERDREIFFMNNVQVNVDEFLKNVLLGARQYCMKEPPSTLGKARVQLKMLYWLDWFAQISFSFFAIWLLNKIFNLTGFFSSLSNFTFERSREV